MDSYFTEDKIVYYLCRVRAKYAKQRNKKHLVHLLSNDNDLNHHKEKKGKDELLLQKILPSRRKWKKLGKEHRYVKDNPNQKINSIEYNAKSIFKTIKFYKKNHPDERFLRNLNRFVAEIQDSVNSNNYRITTPEIYPKPKKKITYDSDKENTCRPISIFTLKDKIIISQTNKYLSSFFDDEFYSLSHAFRAPVKGKELITHHNSIEEIIRYRENFIGSELWVSECDMSKFYDSVSHEVVINQFSKLIRRAEKSGKTIDVRAEKIFHEYLNSYNFVRDVLPKNSSKEYWNHYKIPNGQFGWVQKELISLKHYSSIEGISIGVPQGGALSGLIANLVLDWADNKVLEAQQEELLYIRFCDDMILIHPNKETCSKVVNRYKEALLDLKLVPHEFRDIDQLKKTSNSFWEPKSKSPYKWSEKVTEPDSFPWIGFVGYELHFNGNIRVRKSSLKKERAKQVEVVKKIRKAIQNGNRRKRKGEILESAINRLNGMSVGRIQMWNHSKIDADMCWVNGFKKLDGNRQLNKQLRMLDKNKNHQISKLKKELSEFEDPPLDDPPNRKIPYYGKPYSYYYQVLKKSEKEE